jgi:hypothetical protein
MCIKKERIMHYISLEYFSFLFFFTTKNMMKIKCKQTRLLEFCRLVEAQGVPYEVRSLPVGDFLFQLMPTNEIPPDLSSTAKSHLKQANENMRRNRKITIFPLVFERKDASDLAISMMDGRWESQKVKMKQASKNTEFAGVTKLGVPQQVTLVYGVEGSLRSASAKCCDQECLHRHGGPTLKQVCCRIPFRAFFVLIGAYICFVFVAHIYLYNQLRYEGRSSAQRPRVGGISSGTHDRSAKHGSSSG